MTLAQATPTIHVHERLPTALRALVHADVLTHDAAHYLQAATQAELTIYVFGTYQPGLEWFISALRSVKRKRSRRDFRILSAHRQIRPLIRDIIVGQIDDLQFIGLYGDRFYEHFEREFYLMQTEMVGAGSLQPGFNEKDHRVIDVVVSMKGTFSGGQPKFWVHKIREAQNPSSNGGGNSSLFPFVSSIYWRREGAMGKLEGPQHTSLFAAAFISQGCLPQAYLLRG